METIISKAIEGGYSLPTRGLLFDVPENRLNQVQEWWRNAGVTRKQSDIEDLCISAGYGQGFRDCSIILHPLFWQALSKACGWEGDLCIFGCPDCDTGAKYVIAWKYHALRFHEINLTEGWDAAVAYLSELVK